MVKKKKKSKAQHNSSHPKSLNSGGWARGLPQIWGQFGLFSESLSQTKLQSQGDGQWAISHMQCVLVIPELERQGPEDPLVPISQSSHWSPPGSVESPDSRRRWRPTEEDTQGWPLTSIHVCSHKHVCTRGRGGGPRRQEGKVLTRLEPTVTVAWVPVCLSLSGTGCTSCSLWAI